MYIVPRTSHIQRAISTWFSLFLSVKYRANIKKKRYSDSIKQHCRYIYQKHFLSIVKDKISQQFLQYLHVHRPIEVANINKNR